MAKSILEQYGIKEVADLTVFELNPDGSFGNPVLLLDSLKVSTIETSAEATYAQGGKGNARLVGWDFNKEITLNVEDALFSPKSMSLMFGDGLVKTQSGKITKTISFVNGESGAPTTWKDNMGIERKIENPVFTNEAGENVASSSLASGTRYYATFEVPVEEMVIEVGPNTFPGIYGFVGETFVRSKTDGKDEYFQFIIPKGKITTESSITLEAEGDPSVFGFNVEVMRADDKDGNPTMMQLKKFSLTDESLAAGRGGGGGLGSSDE